MEKENIETKKDTETVSTQTATPDDVEAKIAALETEKAKLISDNANYKVALMKRDKNGSEIEESEEEKTRRIVRETLAEAKISQIDSEKEALLKKTLQENKELKLAHLNKTDIPASTTTHSEGQQVKDTLVTPDQLAAFKARGWTDKDIERYKKNVVRYGR